MKKELIITSIDLLDNLGKIDDYIIEYKELLEKQYNMILKNHINSNEKDIIKNYKRLSELVLIIEFLHND